MRNIYTIHTIVEKYKAILDLEVSIQKKTAEIEALKTQIEQTEPVLVRSECNFFTIKGVQDKDKIDKMLTFFKNIKDMLKLGITEEEIISLGKTREIDVDTALEYIYNDFWINGGFDE